MAEAVIEKVCEEKHKKVDYQLQQDRNDIEDQQKRSEQIEKLTVSMGEILKKHDEKLDDHDDRIKTLENRPLKFWDKIGLLIAGAIITAAMGILVGIISK